MNRSTSISIEYLHSALVELFWSEVSLDDFSQALLNTENCLLNEVLHCEFQHASPLNTTGLQAIQSICSTGFQLLTHWPRESNDAVTGWLGERFYWLHPRAVSQANKHRLCSIVSSQLGKDKHQLACWPRLLEWAVELASRDQFTLLVARGTTFDVEAREFAQAAKLACLELVLPKNSGASSVGLESTSSKHSLDRIVIDWLKDRLESALAYCASGLPAALSIGNQTDPPHAASANASSANGVVIELSRNWRDPTNTVADSSAERDRASIALADRVCCIWVRAGGKIGQLIENRLNDNRFAPASCFIALPHFIHARKQDWKNQTVWLDRGAVGYMVQVDDWKSYASNWLRCTKSFRSSRTVDSQLDDLSPCSIPQQPCLSLHAWLATRPSESWNYLTHCTRGNPAAWPQESAEAYVRRVWNEGAALTADPLVMLVHILQEGRLRGSNRLTRGGAPVVSLSEVPLQELLQSRSFKKHLTKWDWEPYGLLFHQHAIPQARPVLYGAEELFEELQSDERSFFQPIDGKQDWSREQEWRVQGDLDLRAVPAWSAMVFTKTRTEAQQLAWISPYPVLWTEQ